jgi:hypothetical protein
MTEFAVQKNANDRKDREIHEWQFPRPIAYPFTILSPYDSLGNGIPSNKSAQSAFNFIKTETNWKPTKRQLRVIRS